MTRNWDAKAALEKWVARSLRSPVNNLPTDNLNPIYFYKEGDHIPISELESIVIKTARLVDQLGPDYIVIFERAERELEKAKRDMNTLERIRQIAHRSEHSDFESNLIKP